MDMRFLVRGDVQNNCSITAGKAEETEDDGGPPGGCVPSALAAEKAARAPGPHPPGVPPRNQENVGEFASPTPSGPSGHLPLTGGVGPGPSLRGTRSCSLLHHFRRAKFE